MRLLAILSNRNHKRIVRHVAHLFGHELDLYSPDELMDIEEGMPHQGLILAQDYDDDETAISVYQALVKKLPDLKNAQSYLIQNASDENDIAGALPISDYRLEEELTAHLSKVAPRVPGQASHKPQIISNQKQKILYISDDRLMHAIVKDLYKNDDIEVRHAYDGASGYQLYLDYQPNLILSDLDIPIMDGFDLLKKIKIDGQDEQTVMLLFSSTSDEATILKAYALKAKGYLVKPLKPQDLKAKVGKYLTQVH